MGVGPIKVSAHTTFNIQGVWQRDPSVLHDSMDAVEGEAGADPSERASCDESEKFRLRGLRGCSPSIATSSNDASSRTDAWGTEGSSVVGSGTSRAQGPLGRA